MERKTHHRKRQCVNGARLSEKQPCAHQKSIMRDRMSVLLEGALDEELNKELDYSKYGYRNKNTDNSRNDHSQKTMPTNYGDKKLFIPRDRSRKQGPGLIKKYQNTVTQET